MADLSRASSFLPTIKCSSCAQDIEISQMGEHVCSTAAGEPTPPLDSHGNFDRMPHGQNKEVGQSHGKPAKAMPPWVDTYAANRPFMPQDQLTPVSAPPSISVSPMSGRSLHSQPERSATAPVQRGPPSPEIFSSNLDSAFPPFPTAKSRRPQDGGYGGSNLYAEPDQMYAPVSPRSGSSQGVLQRMNTIAPGPFDVKKRQRPDGRSPKTGHQRGTSLLDGTMSTRTTETGPHMNRPMTGHSRSSTASSNGSKSGIIAPKLPSKTNGYGGFGPPGGTEGPPSQFDRSQTCPIPSESREPFRRPSGPSSSEAKNVDGMWLMERAVSPQSPVKRLEPTSGPDRSRPPPRGHSLIRPRTAARPGEVPELNLEEEFGIGNPYHTPTESQSSNGSGYNSDLSKVSSRSSPPRPNTSESRRNFSNAKKDDNLVIDLESSMARLQPREIPTERSPPRDRGSSASNLGPALRFGPSPHSPESLEPPMQSGRLSPIPQLSQAPVSNNPTDKSPGRRPSRPTTAKGNCKGCGEVIKGKSVSSADGLLTGRYHKDCFVCKTCLEPFQTATFYVLDDAPYCERHYHKLNGSVCNTCDKGIEGQYLESESKQKFHPSCLTCSDCRRNLRNEYFEMNGRVYCERDAFRRAQQRGNLGLPGAGTNRMERRTTRLMMM